MAYDITPKRHMTSRRNGAGQHATGKLGWMILGALTREPLQRLGDRRRHLADPLDLMAAEGLQPLDVRSELVLRAYSML